jgi:hypothetical protein
MRRLYDVIYPALFAVTCGFAGTSALAETTVCDGAGAPGSGAGKITSVPVTISAPGVYCVTQKISSNLTSGAAITINANNVLLDLNDFAIGNLAAPASTTIAVGIYAVDRQNIHIRNGVLRGFWVGIGLLNGTQVGLSTALSSGHIVEGIVSDTSYLGGIVVEGPYVSVRNNKIMNTIGSNAVNSTVPGAQDNASGIIVGGGAGINVSGNQVFNTDCTNGCSTASNVTGIDVNPSAGPVIADNIVINQTLTTATTNGSQAIHFGSQNGTGATKNAFVVRNLMTNWTNGISFCSNGMFVCTGDMVSNGAQGVTNAYTSGGTNIANSASNY